MRILVTGSRNWTDEFPILHMIEYFMRFHDPDWMHGGARDGADAIFDRLVLAAGGKEPRVVRPKYHLYPDRPKYAPIARNHEMVDELDPGIDLAAAFLLGSPVKGGTKDTIDYAKSKGIRVIIYNWPGDPDFKG